MGLKVASEAGLLDRVIDLLTDGPEKICLAREDLEAAFRATRPERSRKLSDSEAHQLACLGRHLVTEQSHAAAAVVFSFLRRRAAGRGHFLAYL